MNCELVCAKQPISIVMTTVMMGMVVAVQVVVSTKVDEHRSALSEESPLFATVS